MPRKKEEETEKKGKESRKDRLEMLPVTPEGHDPSPGDQEALAALMVLSTSPTASVPLTYHTMCRPLFPSIE